MQAPTRALIAAPFAEAPEVAPALRPDSGALRLPPEFQSDFAFESIGHQVIVARDAQERGPAVGMAHAFGGGAYLLRARSIGPHALFGRAHAAPLLCHQGVPPLFSGSANLPAAGTWCRADPAMASL